MGLLSKRYAKVTDLADNLTYKTRVIAAAAASAGAFAMTFVLLGIYLEAGTASLSFCALGAGFAAGYAAATTRWALGATYGVIAVIWVLLEGLAAVLGAIATALS